MAVGGVLCASPLCSSLKAAVRFPFSAAFAFGRVSRHASPSSTEVKWLSEHLCVSGKPLSLGFVIKPKEILSLELSLVPYSTHSLDEDAKLIVRCLCQEALHQFELKERCQLKISI